MKYCENHFGFLVASFLVNLVIAVIDGCSFFIPSPTYIYILMLLLESF